MIVTNSYLSLRTREWTIFALKDGHDHENSSESEICKSGKGDFSGDSTEVTEVFQEQQTEETHSIGINNLVVIQLGT